MQTPNRWLEWAIELQSLAQIGLTYTKDIYDQERFERIREMSAEILAEMSDLPLEKVEGLFCNETGYQTPKLDTRAAVFEGEKILLVQENNGEWSLPGGWCEVNTSIAENVVKEVKEEAGLDVRAERILAIQDRSKHNLPVYAYGVCKIYIQCTPLGVSFEANLETTDARYFAVDQLPKLATEKTTAEQVQLCYEAYRSETWDVPFD